MNIINTEPCLNSRSRAVCTQNWVSRAVTNGRLQRPCVWPHGIDRCLWMFSGYTLYRACAFYWRHAEQPQKTEADQKSRHRHALQNTFFVRMHSMLDDGRSRWEACRGHVCDLSPLAGVGGCSRHKVSLWRTFLTGHTPSSHKVALFRAET